MHIFSSTTHAIAEARPYIFSHCRRKACFKVLSHIYWERLLLLLSPFLYKSYDLINRKSLKTKITFFSLCWFYFVWKKSNPLQEKKCLLSRNLSAWSYSSYIKLVLFLQKLPPYKNVKALFSAPCIFSTSNSASEDLPFACMSLQQAFFPAQKKRTEQSINISPNQWKWKIPIKGPIVRSYSAALDLSGQMPHDRKSEQCFQPCPLFKETRQIHYFFAAFISE